jgi:hypothetical protein
MLNEPRAMDGNRKTLKLWTNPIISKNSRTVLGIYIFQGYIFIRKMLRVLHLVFSYSYVKHDLRKNKIVIVPTTDFYRH